MPDQRRQLAAIMFTDIVGYTLFMGQNSSKVLEFVHKSKEIQRQLVEKHDGKWLKEMGDGALTKFNTAMDAVNCAVDIQRASQADLEVDLRIGIHPGDITLENDDDVIDGPPVFRFINDLTKSDVYFVRDHKILRNRNFNKAIYNTKKKQITLYD